MIFQKAGVHFIPAPLREDPKWIEKSLSVPVPPLIRFSDVKGIIHSHSNWSDGLHTVEEMAKECIEQGFEYLVISDHSKSAFYANGLSEERIREQHRYVDELNSRLAPFHIFKSIECDILNDGRLDYSDQILATFDLVIATQVFEYIAKPHLAAEQVHEVLRPGGVLLISVGAVSPRFVEDEHWRYMRSGLRSILAPFSQIEIVPEVFSLGGFCRLINAGLNIFARYEIVRRLLQVTVFPLVNIAGLGLEKLSSSTNDQMAGNYCALARK
jgi:SAM-dependent methyltransferase